VGPTVLAFLRAAAVYGCTDVWESLCDLLATNPDAVEHTTVVVVYARYVDGKRTVESREVAISSIRVQVLRMWDSKLSSLDG
jgi:hypothetical protein